MAPVDFGGFGVGVTESRRHLSSESSKFSGTSESWLSVSSSCGGFNPTSAWHAGHWL